MKKNSFNPKGFSLVIKYNGIEEIIEIPYIKQNNGRDKIGGEHTYQMAIDKFTTKFKDKNELLNFIRANEMANIGDVSNDQIDISMEYIDDTFTGNKDIVYSDNKGLLNFINSNIIKGSWESRIDGFSEAFKMEVFSRIAEDSSYLILLKQKNPFYGLDMAFSLADITKNNNVNDDTHIPAFYRYHNIRGHFISKQNNLLELLVEEIRINNLSFEERSKKENVQRLREIKSEIKHLKGDKTKKYKLNKETNNVLFKIGNASPKYPHPHNPYRY